ncbi:MAG: hypothetical protein E7612_03120 [Ruminococcaceae bacterium]|nr:hypothetical protein [Oscillospiraceae bacterium]
MKKIISMLMALTLLCGSLFSLASCGAPEDAGAEIVVDLGDDVFDFDPTDYYADSNAEQIMSLLYEPLFKINSKGELEHAAAKEYSVDESEREIKIKLRETYWSDEIRVYANDFIYAWREVLLEPSNPNPAAALLYDIENAVAVKAGDLTYSDLGAVSTGAYEITIKYREGGDYKQLLKNLASIATSPLRQDIVSVAKTYWSKEISSIVTNGPFKLQSLSYDIGEFTLARNVGYHQSPNVEDYTEKVRPAALVSFIADDAEYELSYDDIANKTVFYMGNASLEVRAANAKKAKAVDTTSVYSYVFNTDNPIFANKDVRYALSLAIDRNAVVEAVTFGKAATGFLPDAAAKAIYGKNRTACISSDYESNLSQAKSLIAGASLTAAQKSFTLTINNDEESSAIAEIAKAAWTELGFDVTIKKVSTITSKIIDTTLDEEKIITDSAIQTLVKEASYGKRNFDVIAVDWQTYSNDPIVALSAFTSHMNGNGADFNEGIVRMNISGWSSNDFDQYVNVAFNAKNSDERKTALKNAEKILVEEAPIVPVIFNQNFAFISSELSSVKVDGFGHFVFNSAKQKNYQKYLPKEEE